MIRVALYDKNVAEARRLRQVLGSYGDSQKIFNLSVRLSDSYEGFVDDVKSRSAGFYNLALVRVNETGDDILEKLSSLLALLGEVTPRTDVIVLSNDHHQAYNAYSVGARFLRMPFDEREFSNTIGKTLVHAAAVNKRPFPVKSGKAIAVINLNDIMFAEASKRGPIIHHQDGKAVPVKGTLQALHEKLSGLDSQFLRAGGSFIVNLDNIRTADSNSVVFANGETILLPARSRKAVLEAFTSWKKRA